MKHVKKSVLLWYTPQEMYDLVVDIDGFVFFHNQAARRIFDAASGLLLRDMHLEDGGLAA